METSTIERIEEYKNQYLYLDDNFLSRDFDFCVGIESTPKINIQIILFSIDYSCKYIEYQKTEKTETKLPFLKFAGIIKDSIYQFPTFEYECIQDDAEKNETQFRNLIIDHLLSTFQISPPSAPDFFETIYRGLFVHGDHGVQERTVYTVIDYDALSKISSTVSSSPPIVWGVVDELLFEKKVLGNQVDTKIIDVFESRPYLWNITYNGDYLEYFPFVLYLVIMRENVYESYSLVRGNTETKKRENPVSIGSKLDTYSLVDEYGDRYCFTVEPITPNPSVVRYAVFTPKPKYIAGGDDGVGVGVGPAVAPVPAPRVAPPAAPAPGPGLAPAAGVGAAATKVMDAGIDVGLDAGVAMGVDAFMVGMKDTTPDVVGGDKQQDGSLNPVLTLAPTPIVDKPTESYDNVPDSDKEVLEESMSEKIAYPVIYFTEKTGNLAGKHIWGIKSTNLFVSI